MTELLNIIKGKRLPKEVLMLIGILNKSNISSTYHTVFSPGGECLFKVYEKSLQPYYFNISNFISYKVDFSTEQYKKCIKYTRIAINNSTYSDYSII